MKKSFFLILAFSITACTNTTSIYGRHAKASQLQEQARAEREINNYSGAMAMERKAKRLKGQNSLKKDDVAGSIMEAIFNAIFDKEERKPYRGWQ
ncbi:hypothetical protein [Marinibactrum halimedae]|uniref:Lipoprotein n=1 Tax=Marinibactrum halimedae TaxID=1444977 RepID=A0AA37TDU4_9GAMM|nr:hypothetical protein [Marinibactrum halimedae]MCD9459240.1 hypothetical protein [Marinibactrum halimedae]GLS27312.1 hypothetical protein GCM10007877_30310 [Marinibactrum halimedae]